MPLYEYECAQCGRVDEVLQKFSDKPITTCRHCSGKLHKLISQSSFHLKGSGWYVTDYAGKDKSNPPAKNPETKKSAEKSKDSSTTSSTKKKVAKEKSSAST